jgi:DNA-binding NtrC family response regulator
MKSILICWLGFADLKASAGNKESGLGPIGQAAAAMDFDEIVLISDHSKPENLKYVKWLKSKTASKVFLHTVKLSGPTNFGEIYEAAVNVVDNTKKKNDENISLTFHLSPGTPAMAAVWIIIAKTRSPAQLIESSAKEGVKIASVPFDISADFIPDLLRKPDDRLERLAAELPPQAPEFSDIIHRSQVMERIIVKARHFAPRSVPVLIEGETGTGKELFARAIHNASPRNKMPFVTVNCSAIPPELIESELFGHEKGAFTGADKQRKGYFEHANEGILFLDEIGELPLSMQVKLLRVLQEKEIIRVGSTRPIKLNIRIIAATNKNLIREVVSERFRPDLFYRIAVAILKLPPLRERSGDISLLIDKLLEQINIESVDEPGYKHKEISAKAKNIMLQHSWPGNVRELINTLRRAAIWSAGTTIGAADIKDALFLPIASNEDELLNRPLGDSLNLPELMGKLARHYLKRALVEAHGNKTKTAELVGLPSYQTLTNWIEKYKV